VEEGEELLAILAEHPSTRGFVCTKLVEFLVSDTPPEEFVSACKTAWENSGGDVKTILRAILLKPEFIADTTYQRNKVRTPFEYSVATMRAFSAKPASAESKLFYKSYSDIHVDAGHDQLMFPVPTGTPEGADAWTTTASMIGEYRGHLEIASSDLSAFGIDLFGEVRASGIETAEEAASYLLALAMSDRYRQDEFDAVVAELRGSDGIFEPQIADETEALRRAMTLIGVLPSFLLQ
jgi:hypothetical protein